MIKRKWIVTWCGHECDVVGCYCITKEKKKKIDLQQTSYINKDEIGFNMFWHINFDA